MGGRGDARYRVRTDGFGEGGGGFGEGGDRQGIERALRRAEIAGVAEVPAGIVRADEVAPYGVVRAGLVVQYCFFGGLTLDETAEHMGIAKRSVQRAWTMARAWLRKEIAGGISL